MQGGFLLLETGSIRSKNSINVAVKNIFDSSVSIIVYWIFGFGLMFGNSLLGLLGVGFYFYQPELTTKFSSSQVAFFLFQTAFCATAVTIVSGAIAERIYFRVYSYVALLVSGLIYPIYGHWVWGGALGAGKGWLENIGFIDFAGSTVVHSIGGWVSLALIMVVGPRSGRFTQDNKVKELGCSNLPVAGFGAIVLWLGWFGFNGGSNYTFDDHIPSILLTTNICSMFSLLTAFLTARMIYQRSDPRDMITGMLAGLVAITASCKYVDIRSAAIIGIFAGIFAMLGKVFLERMRIDDPVDAIPVHLVNGIWGTLSVALFNRGNLGTSLSFVEQLWVQNVGILTAGIWSFGIPYLFFRTFNHFIRFRVTPEEEELGLNVSEHNVSTELYDFYRILNQDLEENESEPYITEIGHLAKSYKARIERDLQEKTRALKNFLSLTNQGFFTFDRSMKIEIGYSQECHRILSQENLEGKNPAEVLFSSGPKKADFVSSFDLYFKDKIQADVLFNLLDSSIQIHSDDDDDSHVKDIHIQYRVIEDNRIMCIMTDESEKEQLNIQLSEEKEVQDVLIKAITDNQYFSYLIRDAKELFHIFQQVVSINTIQKTDIHFLKSILFDVHDLKANLGFFSFHKTSKFCFEIENILSDLSENSHLNLDKFKTLIQKTQNTFYDELQFFKDKLGDAWVEESGFLSVPTSSVIQIAETVHKSYPQDNHLINIVEGIRRVPAKHIFHRFIDISNKLAVKLGKKINPLSIVGGEVKLPIDIFEDLAQKLIHLIRNMIDHGIEMPEERLKQDKSEEGNLQIIIEERKEDNIPYWIIQFIDDGRGINFDKVQQVAQEKELMQPGTIASKAQLLNILFTEEVSTVSSVSDTSGRGVGLSNIKKSIQALDGDIMVKTKQNKGTVILFKIPIKHKTDIL